MMQTKQRLDVPLKIKSLSETGEFEGYGSVFGVEDSYSDVVVKGAFEKSLSLWAEKGRLSLLRDFCVNTSHGLLQRALVNLASEMAKTIKA